MKRVLLPLFVLIGGVALAAAIFVTGPTLQPKAPPANAPLIRTWEAMAQSVRMTSVTHGTVLPRTESDLVAEVSGRIIRMAPTMVSGGFFKKDDVLFEIDPLDYEVEVEQARARLASARSELVSSKRAHTRQLDLAKKQSTSESLRDDALNRLRIAQAQIREAQARLSRARRDLARTKVTAPYDGRVRSERVDVGQFVNRGNPVAMLYATDFAEVRLPVHDDELAYLNLPLDGIALSVGSEATAMLRAKFAGQQHEWQSTIVRTEGELDPQTRMINLVAQVESPYAAVDGRPPLAVGLFVEAEIQGQMVDNVFVLPRSAIQANQQVYIVTEDNTLEFRDAEILRIVEEDVYISGGLKAGELVCLSTVNNAVEGMFVQPVAAAETQPQTQEPTQTGQVGS
jgi:RND family efflux transporter MFP subunit